MIPLEIQAQRPGATEVAVSAIEGRRCVSVTVGEPENPALLGVDDGTKLAIAAHVSRENAVPLVCHINSAGVPPSEGVEALHGWGVAARELTRSSGIVPIIMCVHETAVSGSALLLGLADVVVMIDGSYSYVSGPRMVQEYTGVPIDNDDLGGARRHAGTSGVAGAVVATADDADAFIADVLALLPANSSELPPLIDTGDPPDRWDNILYISNKVAWGSETWRHSAEFQTRYKNDFGDLEQWHLVLGCGRIRMDSNE